MTGHILATGAGESGAKRGGVDTVEVGALQRKIIANYVVTYPHDRLGRFPYVNNRILRTVSRCASKS
jgi:hypothetical protein